MKNTSSENNWLAKYSTEAFEGLLEDLAACKISMKEVAQKEQISRQAISQGLIHKLGKKDYDAFAKKRKLASLEKAAFRRGHFSSFQNALDNFDEINGQYCPLEFSKELLKELSKLYPKATGITFRKKKILFSYQNEQNLVKWVTVNRSKADYRKGFYRFHVTSPILNNDQVVFLINDSETVVGYSIPRGELTKLKTLSLKVRSPYEPCKYSQFKILEISLS